MFRELDSNEMYEITFDEYQTETDRAHCLVIDGKNVWIPKSQSEDPDLNNHTIEVKGWLIIEKGLEAYLVD